VQVFERDDERCVAAEHVERVGELAQHALAALCRDAPAQPLRRGDVDHARHLQQPARRPALQRSYDVAPVVVPAERAQQLEHREIRLGGSNELDALAGGDAREPSAPHLVGEAFEQHGLADAGFAGDEDRLALVAPAALQMPMEPFEIMVASDEGSDVDRNAAGTGEEAVPLSPHRLQESRRVGVLAQRIAHLQDAHPDDARADRDARPDGTQQLVARHQSSGVLRQVAEQREGLAPQRLLDIADPQLAVDAVEPEVAEDHRPTRGPELGRHRRAKGIRVRVRDARLPGSGRARRPFACAPHRCRCRAPGRPASLRRAGSRPVRIRRGRRQMKAPERPTAPATEHARLYANYTIRPSSPRRGAS
jgi:hypothetical protein